jgi:hypothetical protein
VNRRSALMLVASKTAVLLEGEWLESFWCEQCQENKWYHVCKSDEQTYEVSGVPQELWQQVVGVVNPEGNPSVGEFTRRQSRLLGYQSIKDFKFVG